MSTTTYYKKLCHFVALIERFGGEIGTAPCLLVGELTELIGLHYNSTLEYASPVMEKARKSPHKNIWLVFF